MRFLRLGKAMKRRFFIALVGGAAAWPVIARPQQATPVIGFVSARAPGESASVEAAFRAGLAEAGFVEGDNVHIAFRWAEGHYDRLPALIDDVVKQKVNVIAAFSPPAALAAKAAATKIPIVVNVGIDPVAAGLVASLNRPGGNITGVTFFTAALAAKRLGLLRELVPKTDLVAMLVNPGYPDAEAQVSDVQKASRELSQRVVVLNAGTTGQIDEAFAALVERRAGALMVGADPFLDSRRDQIIALAARYGIPSIYHWREYVLGGGLMSYGASINDAYRMAAVYIGRILKGEKPSEMPVMQPTKFEFVINLKTAKTLGLTFPPGILAIADEVIE
jgi:putative tryptophan/tyrosine transport system substrate-binding protein